MNHEMHHLFFISENTKQVNTPNYPITGQQAKTQIIKKPFLPSPDSSQVQGTNTQEEITVYIINHIYKLPYNAQDTHILKKI